MKRSSKGVAAVPGGKDEGGGGLIFCSILFPRCAPLTVTMTVLALKLDRMCAAHMGGNFLGELLEKIQVDSNLNGLAAVLQRDNHVMPWGTICQCHKIVMGNLDTVANNEGGRSDSADNPRNSTPGEDTTAGGGATKRETSRRRTVRKSRKHPAPLLPRSPLRWETRRARRNIDNHQPNAKSPSKEPR